MEERDEWERIREVLKELRDKHKDSEDVALGNLSAVINNLVLCTYMPEHLEPLYEILDEHLDDILGGKN